MILNCIKSEIMLPGWGATFASTTGMQMSTYKLICYTSSYPVEFGFRDSSSLDTITLNASNKKTNQNLPDFQTGIVAAAHATLDRGHLISCTRTVLFDKIASL